MITLYTIFILAAMLLLAFFTASEMAFTSSNRIKIKGMADEGDPNALNLTRFLEKEGLFLGTTLVGTNIAVVITSVLATRIFREYFSAAAAPALATLVMVPLTLIFAEIVPKMIARRFPEAIAMKVVVPLKGFLRVFRPLIVAVNSVARVLLTPFGKGKASWDVTFSKSDLKRILRLGHETGEVEADEVELIHKVLDFGGKTVEEIMVPLYRVASISGDDTAGDLKRLVSLTGFSRIPVYSGNKHSIAGITNIYDVLFSADEDVERQPIKEFIRDAVFVKNDDGLDIALARLRHRKQPMGIVLDAADKIVGIVTIEDMLEEIVGEIEDR